MKNLNLLFICLIISVFAVNAEAWIRVNQMGYLPADVKVAVLISDEYLDVNSFKVVGVSQNPGRQMVTFPLFLS